MNEAAATSGNARRKATGKKSAQNQGFFARIVNFFKEVLTEIKKVQTPTRAELWQMFLTVVFFVLIIMAFVSVVDIIFNQSMFWIFG